MKIIDFDVAAKRALQEANGAQARAKQTETKANSAKTKVRMAKSALKQAKKTLKAARKDARAAKKELANWREAAAQKRWTFLLVIAPLNVRGATGSAVSPIAVF